MNVPHISCATNAVGSLWATWSQNGACGLVTGLRTRWSGVRKQATAKNAQTGSRAPNLRVKWGKVSFRGVKGRGTKLTDRLEQRIRTNGTISHSPYISSWCGHGDLCLFYDVRGGIRVWPCVNKPLLWNTVADNRSARQLAVKVCNSDILKCLTRGLDAKTSSRTDRHDLHVAPSFLTL